MTDLSGDDSEPIIQGDDPTLLHGGGSGERLGAQNPAIYFGNRDGRDDQIGDGPDCGGKTGESRAPR